MTNDEMPKQKNYTNEFKKEAVRMAQTSGRTRREIAREVGIGLSTLAGWIHQFPDKAKNEPTHSAGNEGLAAEVERLRRENVVLRQEREILKRAVTIFAKEESR